MSGKRANTVERFVICTQSTPTFFCFFAISAYVEAPQAQKPMEVPQHPKAPHLFLFFAISVYVEAP